jgi:opacity protein-like surface antigen
LPKIEFDLLPSGAGGFCLALLTLLVTWPAATPAQTAPEIPAYARVNTFGIFSAFSNDSSHILMGMAERRKLVEVGASYGRRLYLNHIVNWQFNAELLPVALEADPLGRVIIRQTSPIVLTSVQAIGPPITCAPVTTRYNETLPNGVILAGTETVYCHGREWTIGEGMSPVGFRWNFRPSHPLQPFLIGHGGYMYSTRPIPVPFAGSFNFTFDIGAGLELYRSKSRSVRAEYRFHHISNHDTANYNPGIDNGVLQITYAFGR